MSKNTPGPRNDARCGNQAREQVKIFKYVVSLKRDVRCEAEIKRRIGIAKNTFGNTKEISNEQLSVKTRKSLLKTHIWSTYGIESWILSMVMEDGWREWKSGCGGE